MNLRGLAAAALALVVAGAPVLSQAAGRAHHNGGPRVSIGVGVGGGFFDPFPYDPLLDPWYDAYPPQVWGYVPPPAVPCTPADVPTKEPSNSPFTPDYAYDRIDANRCAPQAAAAPAQVVPPPAYYFCRSTNAYYPQVSTCAEGWQQVSPRPPGT